MKTLLQPSHKPTHKPKIIHVLSDRNVGGIKSTSSSLVNSRLQDEFEFLFLTATEVVAQIRIVQPAVTIWHDPCNWYSLRHLLWLRWHSKLLIHEHHYAAGFERWRVRSPQRFHWLLRFAYGIASKVVAISQGQKTWMEQNSLVKSSNLILIQQCRDLAQFLSISPKSATTPLVLGAYGRFSQQKGFVTLLEAMQRVSNPTVKLLIGGYGEQEQQLLDLAGNDPRIEFIGAVGDVPAFLNQCDGIIIPSYWEPWGNVCLEAKAAGKVVIASAIDGLTEQIDQCGILVTPHDADDLARAIEQIYTMPRAQIAAWGNQGRIKVTNAWEDYLVAWEALLRDLCRK